jgi:osmotically-inducible protein OsmY
MRKIFIWSLLAAVPLLHGCVAALVGGAATGIVMHEDRRTVGTITEDQGIEFKTSSRLDDKLRSSHINVTSYNRSVLLTGEVPSAAAKSDADRIARGVDNVRGVVNELQVAGNSSLTARSNDSLLTSKVKTRFVNAQRFNALHVKVVTENSVVYLMGLLKRAEADEASKIASTTGGVRKVIRVFEYLN